MVKWLLCGAAMISGIVIAAETENRSFQFGNFEVIAVQDALSAMRFELFPGMPEEEFLRLTGGGRVPSSVNVFLLKRGDGKSFWWTQGTEENGAGCSVNLNRAAFSGERRFHFAHPYARRPHRRIAWETWRSRFSRALVYVSMPEWEFGKWYGRTTGKTGPEGVACLRQPGENIPVWRRSSARHQGS